jgi:hypothetical protein
MSQKLVPIKGSDRSFSIVRRRVQIAPNKKNKSGFSYENQIDTTATRVAYSTFVSSLPASPGSLIVYKKVRGILEPSEVLRSDENLRQLFSSPKGDVQRYPLLLGYLNSGCDAIVIQLVRPAS